MSSIYADVYHTVPVTGYARLRQYYTIHHTLYWIHTDDVGHSLPGRFPQTLKKLLPATTKREKTP